MIVKHYRIVMDGQTVRGGLDQESAEYYAEQLWMKYGLHVQVVDEDTDEIISEFEV